MMIETILHGYCRDLGSTQSTLLKLDFHTLYYFLLQVQIFLLKSEIVISQGQNFRFVSTYQFDLKHLWIVDQNTF